MTTEEVSDLPYSLLRGSNGDSKSDPSSRSETMMNSLSPTRSILKRRSDHGSSETLLERNPTQERRETRVTFTERKTSNELEDTQRDAAFSLKNTNEPGDMAKTNDATALLELSDRDGTGRDEGIVRESFNGNGETRRRLPPRRPLEKLRSQLDLNQLAKNEKELKANMFFHIGNPIKRWKVERMVPVKLILQLIKTLCLLVQVGIFTTTVSYQRAEFFYTSREVFENHFMLNFTNESPRGTYTAFSIDEVFQRIDYICENYYKLPNITIGGYDFKIVNDTLAPVTMKLRQYTHVDLDASSFTFTLDGTLIETTFTVNSNQVAHEEYKRVSQDPLFNRFYDLIVTFPINNIRIVHRNRAECFAFEICVTFMSNHDMGKIDYYLRESHKERDCNGTLVNGSLSHDLDVFNGFVTVLDVLLMLLSLVSIFLMFTTLKRAKKLGQAMGAFYRDQLGIKLSWWERRHLFPLWHFLNFTSDIIIIIGTAYKIALNFYIVYLASPTRVLLGTAILFQSGVMLRYVSYFKELNALNRTLYLALPEILKFLLCAGFLFLAFSLTGYIVLGPFHPKFISFYDTFETLFCLLNGDDIYATFDQIDIDDDEVAYFYSRIFLFTFLVLFIYFVLNLFTSLVIAAYEASQNRDNSTKNEVRRFVFSGPLTPNGVALRDVTLTKKYVDPQEILKRRDATEQSMKRKRTYSFVEGLGTAA